MVTSVSSASVAAALWRHVLVSLCSAAMPLADCLLACRKARLTCIEVRMADTS